MGGGCTVNAATGIYSRVVLTVTAGSGIELISEDLGESVRVERPDDLPLTGPLGLIGRAVAAFPPEGGIRIRTLNQAPPGSGLGASSALLVALLKGLFEVRRKDVSKRQIVDIAAEIETAAIGVPVGKQDYIAGVYGGVSLMDFGYSGFKRETISDDSLFRTFIEESLILSYTGECRFSGMNNWEMTKGYIEDAEGVRRRLHKIRDLALEAKRSILAGRFSDLSGLVKREWRLRRALAAGVSTDAIEEITTAAGKAGALASKVCGAGGGGCMITLAPPGRRSDVESAIVEAGGSLMPFKIDTEGLKCGQTDH
jgi:D-glycero-alpha-D-manno-heptose-7-phosphate kinase